MYFLLGITINTPTFAQHSFDSQSTFGTVDKGMGVLYVTNKRYHINTVEQHYIYTEPRNGIQFNDRNTVTEKAIFKVLVRHETVQMVSYSPRKTIGLGPYVTFSTNIKVRECRVATSVSRK
jgi:hypothetical protein